MVTATSWKPQNSSAEVQDSGSQEMKGTMFTWYPKSQPILSMDGIGDFTTHFVHWKMIGNFRNVVTSSWKFNTIVWVGVIHNDSSSQSSPVKIYTRMTLVAPNISSFGTKPVPKRKPSKGGETSGIKGPVCGKEKIAGGGPGAWAKEHVFNLLRDLTLFNEMAMQHAYFLSWILRYLCYS